MGRSRIPGLFNRVVIDFHSTQAVCVARIGLKRFTGPRFTLWIRFEYLKSKFDDKYIFQEQISSYCVNPIEGRFFDRIIEGFYFKILSEWLRSVEDGCGGKGSSYRSVNLIPGASWLYVCHWHSACERRHLFSSDV